MSTEQILIVLVGALAAGFVNGLTGFGTGITAMGLWLYAVPPPVAASLVIICSLVAQLQNAALVWRFIAWRRVLPFILPGLAGVPIGAALLSRVDAATFKLGVGLFLVAYATYALLRRRPLCSAWGGRLADVAVGLGGGLLGGLAGFSGVLAVVWSDVRGYTREQGRSLVQSFNVSILLLAVAWHAGSGLLTREVGEASLAALPGTIIGAWLGAKAYRRAGDRGFRQAVLLLLLVCGAVLVWTSS